MSEKASPKYKTSEEIKNYYTIKAKYQKKYKNAVKKIRESNLAISEKKKKMESLKMKCINTNCSNNKGTKFETKKQHLLASCGDIDAPCNLDIDIDRGVFVYLPDVLKSVNIDLNSAKTEIIKLKLEILFGFSTEEEIAEPFEKLKEKYSQLETVVSNLNSIMIENNMVEIGNAETGDVETISKDIFIENEKVKLENLVNKFRLLIREAQQETSVSSVQYFTDAVQQYIDKIIPLLENIQKNKYKEQTIIENEGIFSLVQIKTKLNQKEIELEPQKVITNKK